jgi:spermidine/putrescine-binding protein
VSAIFVVTACSGSTSSASAPAAASAPPPATAAASSATGGDTEGEVVIATAGGVFQDALAKHFYDGFTKATGIKVTPVTINPDEQWAKVKADQEANNVQWDIVNVGPDSLVLQQPYLTDLGADCGVIPNLKKNGAEGVCQQYGFLYVLGGYILGYNTDVYPAGKAPTSAVDFFDTVKFPGNRSMASNEPTYNMMMALYADGVTQDKLWPLDIDRALKKLDTIKSSISVWWESSDQAMQNWRNKEVNLSMFFAGRIKKLQKEGLPIKQVFKGFPRDISGFGILKAAPHPKAAKAFVDYFFADEQAQASLDLSNDINYDPPNKTALKLAQGVDDATRATNPENWNSMLYFDVTVLKDQLPIIQKRWQDWIAK